MTATVTVKARAWPVTVKVSDDADTIDIHPWQEKQFHIDSSLHLTITEAEPAADTPAEPGVTDTEAAMLDKEVEGEPAYSSKRGRKAPTADAVETQPDQ